MDWIQRFTETITRAFVAIVPDEDARAPIALIMFGISLVGIVAVGKNIETMYAMRSGYVQKFDQESNSLVWVRPEGESRAEESK